MQHTLLSADVPIKALAASRSLTLKKQQQQHAGLTIVAAQIK